jgi:hypothetical protein
VCVLFGMLGWLGCWGVWLVGVFLLGGLGVSLSPRPFDLGMVQSLAVSLSGLPFTKGCLHEIF